ncbi:MAG: FeoA family protein [Cytophagales bacterium]|nr:FeoA family protein [Cytophagales bacterium]
MRTEKKYRGGLGVRRLSDLSDGQRVQIKRVNSKSKYGLRLMEMGFIPGEWVRVRWRGLSLGLCCELMSYRVFLGEEEAREVEICF